MTEVAEQFIKNWHEALDERSFEKVDALLSADISGKLSLHPFYRS